MKQRPRTLSARRVPVGELEALRRLPVAEAQRPHSRGECADGPRPCPWVSCRYHLYLDVHPSTGGLKLNFPALDVDELEETCALDVADRGGVNLDQVGRLVNLTREGARQVQARIDKRLKMALWRWKGGGSCDG